MAAASEPVSARRAAAMRVPMHASVKCAAAAASGRAAQISERDTTRRSSSKSPKGPSPRRPAARRGASSRDIPSPLATAATMPSSTRSCSGASAGERETEAAGPADGAEGAASRGAGAVGGEATSGGGGTAVASMGRASGAARARDPEPRDRRRTRVAAPLRMLSSKCGASHTLDMGITTVSPAAFCPCTPRMLFGLTPDPTRAAMSLRTVADGIPGCTSTATVTALWATTRLRPLPAA
mmetsp:Transcript_14646/g.55167  ORF Transcript_14646/g.55167 Transcript_14646/m.55167 type:complete len:239 (+) Transcript_14646:310-1026(+)